MKRLLLVFTILFCITLANAQNPFEKYGYTPKIATLSNGKYNEFHDLDTIVQIGTVLYNTQSKQIIAFLQVDTLYSEVTLQPDIISMWMSPDPLADEYPSWSPYTYCANNPIRYIDPDGRDVWEVNETGEIVNRIKDKTQDAFFMVAKDADGNYQRTFTTDAEGNKNYNSISFKYGTVESQRTTAINSTDSYDTYKVRGDANGTQMFEFMSQNTIVEWSQAKTGIAGDKGLNFLTTSHDVATERGMSNLYSGQLYAGYTIRELNHNHPSNTAYPSGSFDYTDAKGNFHPTGTWGDIGFARDITNNRQANRLNVPTFNIFLPASKSYINYEPNSIRSSYGR